MTSLQKLSARVRVTGVSLIASLAVVGLSMAVLATPAKAGDEHFHLVKTMPVPGGLHSQDISWVDPVHHLYLLADRTNKGIDVYDTKTDKFVRRIDDPNDSGPNGVLVAGDTVWFGDGASHVVATTLDGTVVYNKDTGGSDRADELAYDPVHHIILAANDSDSPPFITFYSSTTGDFVNSISFPQATNGIEQSAWSNETGMMYLNIPEISGQAGVGAIEVINDGGTPHIVNTLGTPEGCEPGGLALGPGYHAVIGCNSSSVGAGAAAAVIDIQGGGTLALFDDIQGSDEVWYNPSDNHYFVAANHNDPAEIGVIDAGGLTSDAPILTDPNVHSHSVAADPNTNRVYVPTRGDSSGDAYVPACGDGCIAVYSATGPSNHEGNEH